MTLDRVLAVVGIALCVVGFVMVGYGFGLMAAAKGRDQ